MIYSTHKVNGAIERDHRIMKIREMKNLNQDAFLSDIANICWDHTVSKTDNVNYCEWTNLLSLIIEKHAPLNQISV